MRPVIAVSSCLLGENVRYDGVAKKDNWIAHELAKIADFMSVCPEVSAGLPVPRPAVQLVQTTEGLKALGVENRTLDITSQLVKFSASEYQGMQQISGYIFKSRSPSCGAFDTPLFDEKGKEINKVAGLHAAWVKENFPRLPVIDERKLANKNDRDAFISEVFRFFMLNL